MEHLPESGRCDPSTPAGVVCVLDRQVPRDEAARDNPSSYLPMLQAYHRAFAVTLQEMLAALPIREGDRVVDVACGDGAYSGWLAERVGPAGSVLAVDLDNECLRLASRAASLRTDVGQIGTCRGSAEELPLADDSVDLVWCAQSLYSLPKTVKALGEMVRVVRPGGAVAVLENDTLHHVLMPLPVELELEVRAAEWAAFTTEIRAPAKYYVARWLSEVLAHVGLSRPVEKVWATTRREPLGPDERFFLEQYLKDLYRRVEKRVSRETRRRLEAYLLPKGEHYLLDREHLVITVLDRLVCGVKPKKALVAPISSGERV